MKIKFVLIILILSSLTSCAGVASKGIFGTGVSVAFDPRSVGTQIDDSIMQKNLTARMVLLDKKYILGKMRILNGSLIDEKFFLFSIEENNQTLNIFFDKNNYNLIGWQTEDIYQNLTITYIYDLKVNQNIEDEIFKLPKNN